MITIAFTTIITLLRGGDDGQICGVCCMNIFQKRERIILFLRSFIHKNMIQYPLVKISKEEWNKKVAATYMYSIPLEDEALPILEEIVDLLDHLHSQPLAQTIEQEYNQYFFTQVFPPICQKILKSRYFKSTKILQMANKILEMSVLLVIRYIQFAQKWPVFAQILVTVFSTDEYYYKTNNQFIDYRSFAHNYIKQANRAWVQQLKEGDMIDVLKLSHLSGKATWSRGKILLVKSSKLKIEYLNDYYEENTFLDKNSYMIAPFKSKSQVFDWRMGLKVGDLVDCEDHYGGWYSSTIIDIMQKQNDRKLVKIAFKVYDEKGNKYDQKGRYFGIGGYNEDVDITSPKLQPYGSIVKENSYYDAGSKTLFDNDDLNDSEFEELCGQTLYALPRKKCLSQFLFNTINHFGREKGFVTPIERLEKSQNIIFLCIYVKGISGIAQCLNKSLVKDLITKLKPIIETHIFCETEQFLKDFNKDRSQMLFSGFKILQKRILTMQAVYEYENEKKIKLVDKCLQSQSLKRKLQGLNELKDIVKSVTYGSDRNKTIKSWIKEQKIFEKIYLTNSHVQLIKKSEQFFRYLINQSILEVTDLERLYKIAQKGDYESRISLYKLFQEVSHIFKKPHVDFLIDTILQSELSLILNEDIDLLNEMSKFSNYFPKDKVRTFFESIILGEIQHEGLYEYATKKYSEIVAKGYEMKSCRRDIIHSFINKLTTHNITQVSKVLKGIFEGIGIGEYGKKDLNQILAEQNIDEVVILAIRNNKGKPNENSIVTEVLNLLGFIYKLSYKVKILVETLKGIWNQMKGNEHTKKCYYKWVNELIGCEQGIGQVNQLQSFQNFFVELFPQDQLGSISAEEFNLMKNLIIEINKKNKYLTPVHLIKEIEYRRKVDMHQLKLTNYFMYIIYNTNNADIYEKGLDFFLELYNAKDNELEDINSLFLDLMNKLYQLKKAGQFVQVKKTLKLINILIDNSEKKHFLDIDSLVTKEAADEITLIIINDIVYVNEYSKKRELTVPLNMTLYQFKKELTKYYNLQVDEVKLSQEREIPEYYNSRVLKQLPINFNDPISLTKRYINTYFEPEVLLNNKLNPKAARCFKVIFQKFSKDGLMSKDQCHQFTSACLSSASKRYDDKVRDLFNKYDYDNDGFLGLDGFLAFYEDAARENRTTTVWSNLKSFGVNSEFRFPNEVAKELTNELFPRKILSESPQFYETLFQLLHVKDIAPIAFHLLGRLPISKKIYTDVLGIGRVNTKQQLNIGEIFKFDDYYSYFYKLVIISYLGQSQQQVEKNWLRMFIDSRAVELIYVNLKKFIQNYDKNSEYQNIEVEIINYKIKMLYQYFLRCFTEQKKLEALSLLQSDFDLDDKIQYLITGLMPKSDQKLNQIIAFKQYDWQGESKSEVCKTFIVFLSNIWVNWSEKIEKEHAKLFTFNKVISILCFLQINEDPTLLIQHFSIFFKKAPSNKLLRTFYCLILCICFYSKENQNLYITQMFKHITQTNITSEYFRILAVLVSKFGMQEERVCEMPQILLSNILNQKNQLTIEGCAKLLSNFHLSKQVAERQIELLWDNCLFGKETSCKKEQTRQAIYELILKVCENSKEVTDTIIKKTLETIDTKFKSIKITYSTQVNQRAATGYAGLKNLGNICYMNSMIQQLYMNKTFRYLLLRIDDKKESVWTLDPKERKVDDNFLHQIQRIFGYLQKTSRLDFIPYAFCVAYKPFGQSVNIMIQQDVQEFVSMFFDRLQAGIKEHPLKRLVDNFYHGKSSNLFKCHQCQQTKKVEQTFYSITLQVKNSKTLSQSFNRFILGEMISDYMCDFCKQRVDVSKKTRISKSPHHLIIHLQRIDMNFETFVNEKLTNKHEFPTSFNLYPYTLDYYDREQLNEANLSKQNPNYQYELTGIICHIGNAQMGHYISYIKNPEGKWFEFNDSVVNSFNPTNIEAECFGGSFTYDDEYDWQKRQNSKSAYLLIYQKTSVNNIELQLNYNEDKIQILQSLNLKQNAPPEPTKITSEQQPTESQQENSSHVEDSQKQKQNEKLKIESEMQQIEMIRKHKSEDNIEVELKEALIKEKWQKGQIEKETGKFVVRVKDQVTPYIPKELLEQIQADNETNFFQKCLASVSFSKFFAKLLILPQNNSQQMVKLCQKLTFGFWLKSPSFKQLLYSLSQYIKSYPSGLREIITQNTNLVSLLIQNSQVEVRTNIANFLANSFSYYIDDKNLTLDEEDLNPDNQLILNFLNNLFSLIPSTVSKCWTKFNQYFQFWYEFSKKSEVTAAYMVRKQFVKHFIDYFLDKKSPLKIYINRPTIGSSYANPNFGMLLKTIESLIEYYINHNIELSKQEKIILINFNFIEKLIHDSYEAIAAKIVRIICPNNLNASEKIAIVLLKGISKANFQNVQPYLDVVHEFILIEDEHQFLRILWVIGKQSLIVSTISKTLSAMNAYSLQDRIYEFHSAISLQNGSSLLEPLFVNNKRTQNFCIICLQELLKLCNKCKILRQYVWSLGPPNYLFGRYVDFFEEFINRYIDESKRIYGYSSSTSFNREQLGKNAKKLYGEVLQKLKASEGDKDIEGEQEGEHQVQKSEQKCRIEAEQIIQSSQENRSSLIQSSAKEDDQIVFQQQPQNPSINILRTHSQQHTLKRPQPLRGEDSDYDYDYNVYTTDKKENLDVIEGQRSEAQQIKITIEQVQNSALRDEGADVEQMRRLANDSDKQNNYNSSEDQNLLEEEYNKWNNQDPLVMALKTEDYNEKIENKKKEENQSWQGEKTYPANNHDANDFPTIQQLGAQPVMNQGDDEKTNKNEDWFEQQLPTMNIKNWQNPSIRADQDYWMGQNSSANPVDESVKAGEPQANKCILRAQEDMMDSPKKVEEERDSEDIHKVYHPVKFIYKMQQQLESGMDHVRIQVHASEVIQVRTYPTGITNKAFTSTYSHKKVSERLDEKMWGDKRSTIVKGYFVTNNTKSTIRLQTEEGSYFIRSLEGAWIWSQQITKIWVPERFVDWPEWSLYSEDQNGGVKNEAVQQISIEEQFM